MSHLYRRERQGFLPRAVFRAAGFIATEATRFVLPFAHSERGGTAVFFAFAIIPLIAFIGLAVDTTRGYLVKSRLNQAIDAAALAGGRVFASATRDDDIRMYFKANFPDGYMGAVVTPLVITPDIINKTLAVSAQATLPTTFMHLVDIDTIPIQSSAQVTIAAQNVEVALVLDITGSMAGSKIAGLRDAANALVDIVVQDQQTPFYTKVGIVPYSMAVNLGPTNAPLARGAIPPAQITSITKANPGVVTSPSHGFNTDDKIFITGGGTMTQLHNVETASVTATNPQFWVVQKLTNDTFNLKKCSSSSCGSSSLVNTSTWGNYTANSGAISCTTVGCPYLTFQRDSDNAWRTWPLSTTDCVTERVGVNAYTDVAPSTAVVGPKYEPAGGVGDNNSCISLPVIQPLSSNKAQLHTMINGLEERGSTAGQIGIAWGWYMLSPNFNALWANAGEQPAAYGTPKLLKVAVIMTDGDFNTIYNKGVVAQDSGPGSGSNHAYKINQDATNGSGYAQAQALCDAMKAPAPGPNIEIFTVGLQLPNQAAIDIMNYCATDASHVYLPASGADMNAVFTDIAMKISRLRLSK